MYYTTPLLICIVLQIAFYHNGVAKFWFTKQKHIWKSQLSRNQKSYKNKN